MHALAVLFRAKLRAALRQTALWSEISATAWPQPWVVDCRSVGSGRAALKYLAPYIFRVALSNNRIVRVADGQVTFRYTVSESGQTAYCTLAVQEFLRRFLQHILPKGFVKVRYYGLFRLALRRSLSRLRGQLLLLQHIAAEAMPAPEASENSTRVVSCPNCGAPMTLERVLLPHNRGPPQLGHAARAAKHRHMPAASERVCQAPACFGVSDRVEQATRIGNSGRSLSSPVLMRAGASGQHARTACIRA